METPSTEKSPSLALRITELLDIGMPLVKEMSEAKDRELPYLKATLQKIRSAFRNLLHKE